MYSSAHLAMGLIIGKITGDYPTAIISSLTIDLDHLIPFARQKAISSFKDFWKATKTSGQPDDTSRNIFHSVFIMGALSLVIAAFNRSVGGVFALGCLGHFLLDACDKDNFYPFYPWKQVNIHGFIKYYSRAELFFTLGLFLIYFLI